jgi:cytokinesis protein
VTISDNQSHYSHLFHPRQSTHEEFEFPRPSDEEVEAMFQQLMLKRDIPDVPNLTTEQKWSLVHSDERMRWNAEMQEMKRQTDGQSSKALSKDNPQWYLKKFLDQTITAKHAASLLVSLRTGTMRWVTVSWV